MRISPVPRHRPSTGSVLGGLALFIALGGTALAATGQLVHIADGTNPSLLAAVDKSGALRTSTASIPVPARVFAVHNYAGEEAYRAILNPSTSTVALNRVVTANHYQVEKARIVVIYYFTVPAGTPCWPNSAFADRRFLGTYMLGPTETVVDTFPTPLVLKPNGTRPWCLIAGGFTRDGSGGGHPNINLSGYVISGTPPTGTPHSAPASASRMDPFAGPGG